MGSSHHDEFVLGGGVTMSVSGGILPPAVATPPTLLGLPPVFALLPPCRFMSNSLFLLLAGVVLTAIKHNTPMFEQSPMWSSSGEGSAWRVMPR